MLNAHDEPSPSISTVAVQRLPLVAAVLLATMVLLRGWVSDDAFITFRVVDMLVHGHGPVFNPGERVQAYTHPLWFFYLAISGRVGVDLYYAAIVGGVACAAGTAFLLSKLLPPLSAVVVLALLGTSTTFLDFSTSGLENSLSHLLIAAMLWTAFAEGGILTGRRALLVVLFGGLAALNRLDLALLVGPVVGYAVYRRPRSVTGLIPLGAWLFLAAWYYGTPLPNTMYAKFGAFGFGEAIRHGLSYLSDYVLAEPLHAAVAALSLAIGIRAAKSRSWPEGRRAEQVLLLACCVGVVLYVAYVIYIGGDFMRGRMFTAPVLVVLVVGAVVLSVDGPPMTPVTAVVVVSLCVISLFVAGKTQYDGRISDAGVVNERAFYPGLWLGQRRGQAVPPAGIASPDSLGVSLRAYAATYGPITVVAAGGLGQLSYFSGDRVTVIDALGLSDAYVAREAPLADQRPGHINRAVVTDYFRTRAVLTLQRDWEARVRALDPTVRSGAVEDARDPVWSDGQAQARYERVREMVSGPMDLGRRLGVVARFLLPRYPSHGEGEVLAQAGEVTVRANYRPVFGTFKTLIGASEGAGDGADWFDPTAAVGMTDRKSRVTVDLGEGHRLSEVSLQADADDTYVVRFSKDGKTFGEQWVAKPIPGLGGLQTRRTPEGFSVEARYLQVSVVAGDAFHSLGRLDFVTELGREARVPGQPKWREPSAVAGDGEASITWRAPADGGQKITKYIVRSIPEGVTVEVGAPAGGATITGLENGTEYRFTVTAVNAVGDGPTSEPSSTVRPAEHVVATRGNVKVRASFTPRSGKFSALLIDPIPPDGTAFLDGNLAFAWNNPFGSVIVDLGESVAITRLTLQGDNNDEYVVDFSGDGKQFGDRHVFAPIGAPGLRTRETPPGFTRQARYLRIGGGIGDTTFALGALEVYSGSVPIIRR